MKLTQEQREDLECGGLQGFELIEDEIQHKTRWSIWHRVVFRKGEELWAYDYETGATEYQDVDYPDEVECYEVEAIPSVKYKAKPKPKVASVAVPAPPPCPVSR